MKCAIFLILQVWIFEISSLDAQGFYKAAVVEYATKGGTNSPSSRILINANEYVEYIQLAAGNQSAQIIVFPEDGLTGFEYLPEIDLVSTEIPDVSEFGNPCSDPKPVYSKTLIDLSCAARTHTIYVVVNLLEKESQNGTKIYYNTNVAFNRTGHIVAKYRKINLFDEHVKTPGNALSTFPTDFGVTFGMFICFDIMFKKPALDVLANNNKVTDIVYSTAWFSELPFLEALSIQHGYAKTNGVNLLAAGLSIPTSGTGGSGIYLADGRVAETYITGFRSSKMIIQDVPIIGERKPSSCEYNQLPSSAPSFRLSLGGGGQLPNITFFKTLTENMENYTFKALDFSKGVISENVCSSSTKFCCSFDIVVRVNSTVQQNYVYKLAAFHGARFTTSHKTIGVQNCGIVACLNDSTKTCGQRHLSAPQGVSFEKISVQGTFAETSSYNQPAAVKFDLEPLTDYTFCRHFDKGKVVINMTTTSTVESLLTFGIYGRVYTNDDKVPGRINTNNSAFFASTNIYLVFLVSGVIFFLQD